jgi:predicted nucleic acid-binding protein
VLREELRPHHTCEGVADGFVYPKVYLVLIDHIAMLPQLYARIIIPQAVLEELQDEGTPAKVKAWVAAHPAWLEVRTVTVPLDVSLALLDMGEREAIRLAQELAADALIIDEPAGREAAKRRGVRVIGTLRLLYDAAAAGLCDLTQAYERLQRTTFRAHPDLYRAFLDMHSQRR